MVKAIDFVVRDSAGGLVRGSVAGEGGNFVQLGAGEEISLNLARESVASFRHQGDDLIITLIDGREVVLSGYFNESGEPNQLYLSQNGEVIAVEFSDVGNGNLMASYGPADGWDKFSSLDDLRFGQGDDLALSQGATDEPAGMAAFLPGLVGLGAGAAAIAGLGVIGAVVGGGGGGGGGTTGPRPPTVNDPDSSQTVMTESSDKTLDVSGTGEPGDRVVVTIGDKTQETTIGTDGTWSVVFPETGLPADGTHETSVTFTHTGGGTTTLDGPTFIVDMTPPAVEVTEGAKSTGDVENATEYADGVTIGGEGEVGATIVVQVGTHTQTTTVGTNGTWSVTFPTSQIPPGEYEVPFKVTATDALGNDTVLNDVLVIDTVNQINISPVTTDNIVSGAEAASGFQISGTSVAGATLTVTIGTVTQNVTVGADGTWTLNYAAGTLPGGEYDATITATTTDAAGNVSTQSHTFRVDTTTSVAFAPALIATDGIVNATEAAAGVTMTGTAQPGATVQVAWNGATLPATVAADGSWTVTFPASGIPAGEYVSVATVTATDAVGNTATATREVRVDTVNMVDVNSVTADNAVNGAEVAAGFQVSGISTAGAAVTVVIQGVSQNVTAGADGRWTVNYAAGALPAGEYNATVNATSTDAAGNVATDSHTFRVDTTTTVAFAPGLLAGDGIVNAAEAAGGVVLTGTAEPGATVQVAWNGTTLPATVAANGTWTVTFPAAPGEYTLPATVTATDAYGNTATATRDVRMDTTVAVGMGVQASDDIVSGAEKAAGLTLTGTADPGATVRVTFEGVTRTVTADTSGNWSANYASSEYRSGTYNTTVQVSATDAAGNTASTTHTVKVDTEVVPLTGDTASPGADDVLNKAEAANGVVVTGTVEAGSTVTVKFGPNGTEINATVDANGNWTATIPAGQVPAGESTVAMTISATDHVGNTSTITENVKVDTVVNPLTQSGAVAGDGVINAAEAAAGVAITGTVERGSTVVLTLSTGRTITASVDAAGQWTATLAATDLAEGRVTYTVTATDPAGNVSTIGDGANGGTTLQFNVDTEAPAAPAITDITRNSTSVSAIFADLDNGTNTFHQVGASGAATSMNVTTTDLPGEVDLYQFTNGGVPDGSYLVIESTDAADNSASTLVIVNNTNTVTVDLGRDGLENFDFSSIDLSFAPQASLTLTATDLQALTGPDHQLVIHGGSDDHVSLDNATATGQTVNGYTVYSLGDGTVLVDEDIQTTII